jgi:hypothetical protein
MDFGRDILNLAGCVSYWSTFKVLYHSTGTVVLIIIKKTVYKLLKRGKIRELLTKFTVVNAKDPLFLIRKFFRSIVEFPCEGLGFWGKRG